MSDLTQTKAAADLKYIGNLARVNFPEYAEAIDKTVRALQQRIQDQQGAALDILLLGYLAAGMSPQHIEVVGKMTNTGYTFSIQLKPAVPRGSIDALPAVLRGEAGV